MPVDLSLASTYGAIFLSKASFQSSRVGLTPKRVFVLVVAEGIVTYKAGDQVWLEGKNLHINQPTHKLAPRRYGPFRVVQVMSPVNYRLELPTQWSIHPVFHIDLLTPYRETITHGANYQRPPPDLVDNEEEYEVEAILDSRKFGRGRRLQHLIKWKGYPDSDNQW